MTTENTAVYSYESKNPLFSLGFSTRKDLKLRVAIGSISSPMTTKDFKENKVKKKIKRKKKIGRNCSTFRRR